MIRSELRLFNSIFSLCICSPFSLSKTQNTNKPVHYGNMKADLIMRNYFRNRSEMSNIMMIDLFDQLKTVKVGSAFFNDHRWIHLNVLIQKNLINFSITEQLKLLQALTRLNHFNELFNSLFVNLIGKLDTLQPNQKAALFYFKAKRGKTNAQLVKRLSDSIIISLKSPSLKITFPKQYVKSKAEKESQQQQQQLFPDTSGQVQQISCRNLILCFWSLQKMKIKDSLLTNCILKQIIRPRVQEIPASLFPLLLSSLWLHGMQHKRIYAEITFQLKKRESELTLLDRDKVKMLICMLCKPEISPIIQSKEKQAQSPLRKQQKLKLSETRKILVLWLMQNMMMKHEDKLQKSEILLSTTAYQILTNASEANIIDIELYQKYLSIIAEDLIKIQTKQVVYLLSIIQRIRNYSRKNNRTNEIQNICSKEHKILSQHLQRNLFGFLQKINEDHPARALLRKMILSNFIEVPKVFKKKLVHEENTLKNKRAFSSRSQSTAEHKKQQSDQTKKSTPKRGSRRQSQRKAPKSETQLQ